MQGVAGQDVDGEGIHQRLQRRRRLAVRLALQAVENRVHLAELVLRVSVSLYTNPPSAGPGAVRRGRDHSNV